MNRLHKLLVICAGQLVLFAQASWAADSYHPLNVQEDEAKYTLTLNTIPNGAGSFNYSSGSVFSAGQSIYLYNYANTDFVFAYWLTGDTIISRDSELNYTMPDHDATLTAVYEYRPESPDNPNSALGYYTVTLMSQPAGAGSFSWNTKTKRLAGSSGYIYAYNNSDFVFREWQKDGKTVSTDWNYSFIMPEEDITLVAVYDYNPMNPGNPGANYLNAETGEFIVDDFTAGYLQDAAYYATNGNYNDVQMITVAGPVSQYDWGVANIFPNCTHLDMSRTYGIIYVPSYNFSDNQVLTTVALPADIELIDYYAFYNCSSLSSISVYAATPPTIGYQAFYGIADSIVYVPFDAIPLYQQAEGWRDFTILPLARDVSSLEVNLPESADLTLYKDMYIELLNTVSGQKQRYVITNRQTYTFNSLPKRTDYNIYLKNSQGNILGQIDNVAVGYDGQGDASVTFTNLMVPRDLTMQVLTPNGADVTDQVTITWYDQKDTYLTRGNTLIGQLDGTKVKYRVQLPQALAMLYQLPADASYEVKATNKLVYSLTAIPQVTISGKVLDIKTEQPISGATVAVSQMLNGLYSKSFTTKTDNKGQWSLQVFEAKTDVTASMEDYVSKNLQDVMIPSDTINFSLKDINGTTIFIGLTYQPTGGELQQFYNDYANVNYSVCIDPSDPLANEKPQLEYNVQYPQIVLMEQLPAGTLLRVTATSKNQKFVPVTATATVDNVDRANVTLPIVQLGGINASFRQTENRSVVGILYDANGRFLKKYNYATSTLSINEMQDGQYTLVTMASTQLFNSVGSISKFAEAGLREGVDFVKNTVTVKSGEITAINNAFIPFLDETKLYYTGNATSITVNKSQITTGNYLTVTGKIDFKSAYADQVSDVKLIVNLPEGTAFVENSVMRGAQTATYTYADNHVVIPLDYYGERVRFCFIPTIGGDFTATGSVQFTINDKTVTQPIGNFNFFVKDLSINVPSTVATTTVPISGTAVGKSTIEIFDNDILIGNTTSLANGTWDTNCELKDPYNLSSHNIYAKVTTKTGMELTTETKTVFYDKSMIVPEKLTMLYYNPEFSDQYNIVFDLKNGTVTPSSYYFFPYKNWPLWYITYETEPKDFTFIADLTNNDPNVVSGVTIRVYTDDGNWRNLEATYDTSIGKWVAVSYFTTNSLPVGVKVQVSAQNVFYADIDKASDEYASLDEFISSFLEEDEIMNENEETISEELSKEDYNIDIVSQLFNQYYGLNISDIQENELLEMDDDVFAIYLDSLYKEADAIEEDIYDELLSVIKDHHRYGITEETQEDGSLLRRTVSSTEGLTPDVMLSDGFVQIPSTSGVLLERITDEAYELADFTNNIYIKYELDQSTAHAPIRGISASVIWDVILDQIKSSAKTILSDKDKLTQLYSNFNADRKFKLEKITNLERSYQKSLDRLNKRLESGVIGLSSLELEVQRRSLLAKMNNLEKKKEKMMKLPRSMARVNNVIFELTETYNLYNRLITYHNKINSLIVPECVREQLPDLASILDGMIARVKGEYLNYTTWRVSLYTVSKVGDIALAKIPLLPNILNMLEDAAVSIRDDQFDRYTGNDIEMIRKNINAGKNKCNDGNDDDDNNDENDDNNPPYPQITPIHDPSGYVYESVPSNRLKGVTATCYYKETVEDMYGDLHENVELWDAAEYAQENPLFTDENGMYRWDVPQGLWQVKFEKEGYQTTYSEWLPVPPPQLEVNIAMKQMLQPTVTSAKAYDEGIEVTFDKYMNPESLTTDNIILTRNSVVVDGTIELLNEEAANEGQNKTYASKVRFNMPEGDELLSTDEIKLTVRKSVESYAGMQMQDDFTQSFEVEPKVRTIAVDELINVAYGGERTLIVAALPADASKGKKMHVKTLSSMIATTQSDVLTLDENGQAELTVSGQLPGSTVINFTVDDTDVKGSMTVNVKEAVKLVTLAPRASRVSGTELYRGSAILLTSETEGAEIWYTLDGSCPCNSETALKYNPDEPIIIASDNVVIKAQAQGKDLEESEISEFHYKLKTSTLGYQLPVGWTWISHNLEEPVSTSTFQDGAERIVSQTQEIINDPNFGFIGALHELKPATGYKIQQKDQGEVRLSGYEWNAVSQTVPLAKGWNWIGYPLNQTMTLDEAFAFFKPAEGDYIVGQNGFSEFAEGMWHGTLEGMIPGEGFLYKSISSNEITFNTTIVSNAASLIGKRNLLKNSPWAVDKNAYPNITPMTALLYINGIQSIDGEYVVAAFSDTECRGIGQWQEGRLLMNLYGVGGEKLHFLAFNTKTESVYNISETIEFGSEPVGSWGMPYTLTLSGGTTDINELYSELTVTPYVAYDHITVTAGGHIISHISLTDMSGRTLFNRSINDKGATIVTTQLPEGIYIVTVVADGRTYYKKIIKTNR